MAAGTEAAHVQEDHEDEEAGAGGGGQAGGPVGDAELAEEAHGTPVVEGGFFKPGLAVEDGSYGAGDEAAVGVAEIFEMEAAGKQIGVDGVACGVMAGEHLAGDLCVTGSSRADQAKLVSAEVRHEAEEEKEEADGEEDDDFKRRGDGGSLREGCAGVWRESGRWRTSGKGSPASSGGRVG